MQHWSYHQEEGMALFTWVSIMFMAFCMLLIPLSSIHKDVTSSFVRSVVPQHGENETYTKIYFVRAVDGYVAETCDVEIVWPMDHAATCHGLLCSTVFMEGTTKKVHKVLCYYFLN